MTSLSIIHEKIIDLKYRKTSVVNLDYLRKIKLRCTNAKKENF